MSTHWSDLNDEDLLEKRISDLKLRIDPSPLAGAIAEFYTEITQKGLQFLPPCFLADEWFCPVGIPAIGIPFYLCHPRTKKLEQKMIFEVEGGTPSWFLKLMRHETGHAYSYAYQLYKRKAWQRIFGLASKAYPDTYQPRPYSRSYVIHLDNGYGQNHPDEDFAETFAVWLTPGLDWKKRYSGWKALKKLEFVDDLMKSVVGQSPLHHPPFKAREHDGLRIKLKTYYARKKRTYAESYPDFYDGDLMNIFTHSPQVQSQMKAYRYLKINRHEIIKVVAGWTREKQYTVSDLIQNLILRSKELDLYVRHDGHHTDTQVTAYITTLVMNHLLTGQYKKTKHAKVPSI